MKIKDKSPCSTMGERIRRVREIRGMTQGELAERSGVSEPTIQSYERDELTPQSDVLEKLANALDCRAQFLLDGIPKVGDMTTHWKIGKRVSVTFEIDSDLLSDLQRAASEEGKSISEKIENTLWWEMERAFEEADNAQ